MKELLHLINNFEKRNNISTTLILQSDGSGHLEEFWDEETIFDFEDTDNMTHLLKNIQLLINEDGYCSKPIQIVN